MDARFYNSEEIDIARLANDLENMYRIQGYEVQQIGNKDQMMVQLKKGGDLVALIGLQAALSVIIQRTAGGTVAMIGQQKWLDKAAVGAVGLVAAPVLWPLMITAGAGGMRVTDGFGITGGSCGAGGTYGCGCGCGAGCFGVGGV